MTQEEAQAIAFASSNKEKTANTHKSSTTGRRKGHLKVNVFILCGFVNPFPGDIGNFVSTLKILTLVLNPLILYLTRSVLVV